MRFLKHNLASIFLVTILVISIFMLLFAASISYQQVRTLKQSQQSVSRSYKIYLELEQLNSFLSDAETGQRGFLLTHDSIFLQPYYEALEKIKWSFSRLDSYTEGDFEKKKNLDTLVYLINQRLIFLDHVMSNSEIRVETSDTLGYLMTRGRELMTMSLAQIDRMVFDELQLLKQRELEHEKDLQFSPVTILSVVLISIVVFILSFYRINKEMQGIVKTNNKLVISKRIFEQAEQIADISHWHWDVKENRMNYSVNLYKLLGCNANEFEPTFDNFLQFVHPSDRHLLIENKKKIQRELSPTTIFYRILRKDGELRFFKSVGKFITDEYGKNISIGIHADITEQHNTDKMMGEKLADLERSNRQLSAFSHIASHDLQEPLRKIQTFISRIKVNDLTLVPENVRDYLSGVKKETIRMQKFITDLLLYSRASKADKTFESADINEILDNSKKELSHRIEEQNAIINSSSDLPTMNVIPFQMQQLFSNLISNSIKYSKPGVSPIIDVSIERVLGREVPGFAGEPDSKFYKINFSDNGIGFDQQYAEKIFTLFYRLHNNKEYTGTGIGLAICKIIVENHKGFITAQGIQGQGSVFSIFLPMGK